MDDGCRFGHSLRAVFPNGNSALSEKVQQAAKWLFHSPQPTSGQVFVMLAYRFMDLPLGHNPATLPPCHT